MYMRRKNYHLDSGLNFSIPLEDLIGTRSEDFTQGQSLYKLVEGAIGDCIYRWFALREENDASRVRLLAGDKRVIPMNDKLPGRARCHN